jgi:glycosyltransferase involved in cell wall biosynthesis
MRIGIDGRTMLSWKGGEGAGIGHYTFLLTKNLLRQDRENEYVIFLDKAVSGRIRQEVLGDHPNATIRHFPFANAKKALPFVYTHMVISAAFERAKLDLLHAPANSLPLFYRRPSVITVHDLAIYDHPEWFPSPYPNSLGFSERIVVPYSVKQARRIIAVSDQTKQDLIRVFNLPPEKIDVVYEGAGAPKGQASLDTMKQFGLESKRYFLFLGTLEPRKNIPTALSAFVEFVKADPEHRRDFRFVVAGRKGWKYEPIMEAIDAANQELAKLLDDYGFDRVRYLGYIKHEHKASLLRNALAFVFPSFYEGFGLPVIEAMSLKVPVICSRAASLPELCGSAGILVEPQDQPAITAAMERMVGDPEYTLKLGEQGQAQAAKFSWKRAATETLAVYQKVPDTPETSEDIDLPLDKIWGM